MSVVDLLKMSLSSLWRRKLRTILTILGVVIGTASIVVMISLGLGLNRSMMEQIEEYGGITTINVYGGDSGYYGYEVAVAVDSDSEQQEPVRIDDAAIEAFSQMEHVELASPVLSMIGYNFTFAPPAVTFLPALVPHLSPAADGSCNR